VRHKQTIIYSLVNESKVIDGVMDNMLAFSAVDRGVTCLFVLIIGRYHYHIIKNSVFAIIY